MGTLRDQKLISHGVWLLILSAFLVTAQESVEKPQGEEEKLEGNTQHNTPPSIFYEPNWIFKCIPDEGCQRSDFPQQFTNVTSHLTFDSLQLCKSVCGRFGGLWPRPVTAALGMQTVKIHPKSLRFDLVNAAAEARQLLVEMTQIATRNMMDECKNKPIRNDTLPVIVYISVKSSDLTLSWETDESYMVDVQTKGLSQVTVHIMSETVYGARHGLETLTHLVTGDYPDLSDEDKCTLHLISGAKIRDRPVYKHRGLVLDTARNFIPMKDIKKTIDGMAASKMNVFHWHVTDTQSFPFESFRVPQLTRYGAYSAKHIYSIQDVIGLIKYAQLRGVRVVIEIDAPAHAGNGWQWGKEYEYGDLAVCVNAQPWRESCIQPPCGQLNPVNPFVYKVIKDLYRDIVDVVPNPALLHMGGDEVFINCWNNTPEIRQHLQKNNKDLTVDNYIDLWAEFHNKVLTAWDEVYEEVGITEKQPVMLWSSELAQAHRIQKHLDKSRYIIEVWEPQISPLLNQLINLGYRTISVPKDVWYLDRGFWGSTKYANWRRMYANTLPKDKNCLGGEVAMWSEYVDNADLDTRIWPRAAAVAERLWSDPTSTGNTAEPRLQRHRSRLISRGLKPDVLSPEWCAQHDGKCL